jgi:DUF177 domain-containing protein
MKDLLVNNLEIARKQDQLKGEIDVACLERLSEMTVNENNDTHKIYYQLTGTQTKLHLPSLHLAINTVLPVICQRCLERMQLELSLNYDYVLSTTEPDVFEGDENIDWLEISQAMNLNELIEDELLIAIPLAPVHQADCKPVSYEAGEKHNPFDVLKKLKNKT